MYTFARRVFVFLVCLTLITPFLVFRDMLFPFITSKAFVMRLLVELALPFYAYLLITDKTLRPKLKNPLTLSVVAFFVVNVLSSFVGLNLTRSLWGNFERMGGAYYLLHLTLIYFYILTMVAMGKPGRRFWMVVVSATSLLALYGVLLRMGFYQFVPDPSLPRVSATLGNPIFFASFLILPMFLCFFLAAEEDSWGKRALLSACGALYLFGIFFSATRGAAVGLVVGIFIAGIVFVVLSESKKIKMTGLGILFAIAVVIAGLFVFSDKLPAASRWTRFTKLNDSNAQARLIQWRSALQGFKDGPVLGVGPENYMVISNRYYDPEMYKYDASWFDKPHNYILEILITTGVLGLLAYIAIIISSFWILWRAYHERFISPLQFCLLAAALVAYQIQNLFVFDTVSASLMFFVFLGFVGFLGYVVDQLKPSVQSSSKKQLAHKDLAMTVFVAVFIVAAYAVYATNVVPMSISKAVNYGYAYMPVEPKVGLQHYDRALSLPFNFDQPETGSKFIDSVSALVQQPDSKLTVVQVKEAIQKSIEFQEHVTEKFPLDPIAWQKLSYAYLLSSVVNQVPDVSRSEAAIQKATELAPKRTEAQQQLVQIRLTQNKLPEAKELLENILEVQPLRIDLRWQLALVDYSLGKKSEAAQAGEQLLTAGYQPRSAANLSWLIEYYEQQGNWQRVVGLRELGVSVEPSNIALYADLARAYAKAGDKTRAINLANKIIDAEPSKKAEMEEFINSLQ